jgi:hypothetical protein
VPATSHERLFDRRLGPDFLAALPSTPGVYRVFDETGSLVYVGKSNNLRRRLAQYRNAGRRKHQAKLRTIVRAARRIEITPCPSHLDACLLEARLIREHRPRLNVAGAFHFLYPLLGLQDRNGNLGLCHTTSPDGFPAWQLHGAYRSRATTLDAFRALTSLLGFLVRAERRPQEPIPPFSAVRVFRRLAPDWRTPLDAFLRGADDSALARLAVTLLAKPAARRRAADVEALLSTLRRFWHLELAPLAHARAAVGSTAWPVPQAERDPLFLRARHHAEQLT